MKWRTLDGKVYERTGERRLLEPGELHWCNGDWDGPQPYDNVDPHACAVWKLSDDQDWQPPELPAADSESPIDRLIREAEYTDNLGKVGVLATLYQAKALERIAKSLGLLSACVEDLWDREDWCRKERMQTIRAEQAETRAVCSMCNHGEHASCEYLSWVDRDRFSRAMPKPCECPICWQAPDLIEPNAMRPPLHRFEGMEDNHFCTACGAGRLHPIHKT